MQQTPEWQLLPHDLLEQQIGQADLLTAMYAGENGITIESESEKLLSDLREITESPDTGSPPFSTAPLATFSLPLAVQNGSDDGNEKILSLIIKLPFYNDEPNTTPDEPLPRAQIRIQQPSWLNKAATTELNNQASESTEDLFTILYAIQENASQAYTASQSIPESSTLTSDIPLGSLVRVWFYFPSISTKSKREDFITWAPHYSITGFLCAGKPGLLCVEGYSREIDEYMRFIKTESWGDIPSHHKKVSERYREEIDDAGGRVFNHMEEITDMVGERRGHFGNRGDMKIIEKWLVDRGLGEAFTKVLM